MFACVDGCGKFDLWDLNVDTENFVVWFKINSLLDDSMPLIIEYRKYYPNNKASTQVSGRALNKIVWEKDGHKVAIGGASGDVFVYDVGEVWICYGPLLV